MDGTQGYNFSELIDPAMAGGMGLVWLIVSIVAWLVIAIITAMVAKSKGYSSAGGFFAGFFLGFLGLIIYGCMADAVSQQHLARIAQLIEHQAPRAQVAPPIPPPPAG
jgi:predicted metal-binding membrane protein